MKSLIPHRRIFFMADAFLLLGSFLFQETTADININGKCYRCAKSIEDPHIHTYDGKEYQCQGTGDYVLTKSKSSSFEAQARFWVPGEGTVLKGGRNGATTTAAVLSTGVGAEKPIEMHVVPEGMPTTGQLPTSVNDCTVEYLVDGNVKEFPDNTATSFEKGRHTYTDTDNGYTFDRYRQLGWSSYHHWRQFEMLESGTIYKAQKKFDDTFGCYLNIYICLPCDFGEEFKGLFGNPNGDISDDFETRDGKRITENIPTLREETKYCATNWCVGDKENSLFKTPGEYERCSSDEFNDLDDIVRNAPDDIKSQCKNNTSCIIDAVETGNIETGLRNLEDTNSIKEEEVVTTGEDEKSDSYTCASAGMEATKAWGASSDHFSHPININLPHDELNSCFLNNGFTQLGWSFLVSADGLSWDFPMYAGGTTCSDYGKVVGKLTVKYDAGTQVCEGSYESLEGYTLQEFQFFCGSTTFPTVPDSDTPTVATKKTLLKSSFMVTPTVATTLYGCNHEETDSHTTDKCEITGVSKRTDQGDGINGNQYVSVIAHAISCEGPSPSQTDSPTKAPTTGSPTNSPTKALTTGSPTKSTFSLTGSSNGDPHFKTWSSHKYDFHGACDLVLFNNPAFANGLGLTIHIRTKIETWWSYIEVAVIQIGDYLLEMMGGPDGEGPNVWINGSPGTGLDVENDPNLKSFESELGAILKGFKIHYKHVSSKQHKIRIDLNSKGDAISLGTYKDWVSVNVKAIDEQNFLGAKGLMGEYPSGSMVGRDGTTVFVEADAFGQEWQVLSIEPMLFHEAGRVQHPDKCAMPTLDASAGRKNRRLGEARITEEAAALACAHADTDDKDGCIFDVLATNDKDMAGAY